MDTTHDDLTEQEQTPLSDESLPPFVAYQIEEESREHAPSSAGNAGEYYRHGKVEAEAHRVSDEVTREAQRRVREAQALSGADASVHADIPATPPAPLLPVAPGETSLPTPKTPRRFLVPLDGTLLGERVFPYVKALARLSGAEVLLAHITPTEPPALLGRLLHSEGSAREDALRAFAPEALYYLRYVRGGWMTIATQTDILHITAPTVADGLLSIEESRDIDFVALALRDHDESDHMGLGNIVDRVIRFGAVPALVVPPQADAAAHPFALRHVLVPLDGSPLAEGALGLLAGLLAQAQPTASERMTVTLLAVAENATVLPDYQSYLDVLRNKLLLDPAWAGVQIYADALVGSPPGAIVGAVDRGNRSDTRDDTRPVDMLVMSSHGRGGLNRWLLGSVTSYVLPRSHAPVIVVPPACQTQP
ncbi:MAG TPA: universal stress protein [Ktedonobacterales bacterium]|jgi:nucleotide-binding universal stress UspA family protein